MLASPFVLASLALGLLAPQTETVSITKSYKEKEVARYTFTLEGDMHGETMKASASIQTTLDKILEKGKAQISLKLSDFKMEMGANTAPAPAALDTSAVFDAQGFPDKVAVKDAEFIVALYAMAGLLPEKPLAKDASAPIDWTASDKSMTLKGKITLLGTSEVGGKKTAQLEIALTAAPDGDSPGKVKLKSTIDLATGALIESNGTVEIGDEDTVKIAFKAK